MSDDLLRTLSRIKIGIADDVLSSKPNFLRDLHAATGIVHSFAGPPLGDSFDLLVRSIGTSSKALEACGKVSIHPVFEGLGAREAIEPLFKSVSLFPRVPDTAHLISMASRPSALETFMPSLDQITEAMDKIKSLRLDCASRLVFGGLAKLSAVGNALTIKPFDEGAMRAIRETLGDWRKFTLPDAILNDAIERDRFYVDCGFDSDIAAIPEMGYLDSLRATRVLPGSEEKDGSTISLEGLDFGSDEDIATQRMKEAYLCLFRLETRLRRFIDRAMTDRFGSDWARRCLPGNGELYLAWCDRKDRETADRRSEEPLIWYADFSDYERIITKKDNWNTVFEPVFRRRESLRESLRRLCTFRKPTMHARIITKLELTLISAEVQWILSQIDAIEYGN